MPKSKPDPDQSKKDRHKPSRLVRIKEVFAPGLEQLAKERATSLPEEVNRAIREMLEREGKWPVSPDKEDVR